jgi:hypothetical protein
MIACVTVYATDSSNKDFLIAPPEGTMILMARFSASIFMHVYVEKDVRNGLNMMKYVVNHHDNFENPYVSFLFGLLLFLLSWVIELNVMLVMTSLHNVMSISMKYISLAAIGEIPKIYFKSMKDNKMIQVNGLPLQITKTRVDKPLKGASCTIFIMRYIYKVCRTTFCAFGYYFMPFVAIFINGKFMISDPPELAH